MDMKRLLLEALEKKKLKDTRGKEFSQAIINYNTNHSF